MQYFLGGDVINYINTQYFWGDDSIIFSNTLYYRRIDQYDVFVNVRYSLYLAIYSISRELTPLY